MLAVIKQPQQISMLQPELSAATAATWLSWRTPSASITLGTTSAPASIPARLASHTPSAKPKAARLAASTARRVFPYRRPR